MRIVAWALLFLCSFAVTAGREPASRVIEVSTAEELMAAVRESSTRTIIRLTPGRYRVTAMKDEGEYLDCRSKRRSPIPVTVGLKLSGQDVQLLGPDNGEAVIETSANYGIYLDGCVGCGIERLTVEVGVDTVAFGGAIVARASSAMVTNCTIRGSGHRNDQAVGLLAQEGADLAIEFNEIVDHSTGVALLNDAKAVIRNNLMEGPRSETAGVSLSIQCNAVAMVERNLFSRFTSGLWAFGEGPTVTFEGNIIENMRDRGIDAGRRGDKVRMSLRRNVLYQCGGGGILMHYTESQVASRNIVVETGHLSPPVATIEWFEDGSKTAAHGNTLYNNITQSDPVGGGSNEMFWRARRQWTRTYRNTAVGVDGRHKFHESAFLTRYGRWAD